MRNSKPEYTVQPLDYHEEQAREKAHRALPEKEQPHMLVYMGMLDYKVISVHESEAEAEAALEAMSARCDALNQHLEEWLATPSHLRKSYEQERPPTMAVPGMTRQAHGHDFQVRTQGSLDHLTAAIQSCY